MKNGKAKKFRFLLLLPFYTVILSLLLIAYSLLGVVGLGAALFSLLFLSILKVDYRRHPTMLFFARSLKVNPEWLYEGKGNPQ